MRLIICLTALIFNDSVSYALISVQSHSIPMHSTHFKRQKKHVQYLVSGGVLGVRMVVDVYVTQRVTHVADSANNDTDTLPKKIENHPNEFPIYMTYFNRIFCLQCCPTKNGTEWIIEADNVNQYKINKLLETCVKQKCNQLGATIVSITIDRQNHDIVPLSLNENGRDVHLTLSRHFDTYLDTRTPIRYRNDTFSVWFGLIRALIN